MVISYTVIPVKILFYYGIAITFLDKITDWLW